MKYEYSTYNKIKESTLDYCQHKGEDHKNQDDIDGELADAAELLVYYRRQREALSRGDWDNFAADPYTRVTGMWN